MKVSIVISILDSHEIFRRQLLHFEKMQLPDDVEFIFIDDGSDIPLSANGSSVRNLTLFATNDKRPWTQPIARNKGANIAKGEYLICTDIDHIIPKELIEFILHTDYDIIRFRREVGILDEHGNFTQDMDELKRWGYLPKAEGTVKIAAHGNSYAIKRELFLKFGGSQQRTRYPNRDEQKIKRWTHAIKDQLKLLFEEGRPTIYMFPNGRFCGSKDYNPFGFFHSLKRDSLDRTPKQENVRLSNKQRRRLHADSVLLHQR